MTDRFALLSPDEIRTAFNQEVSSLARHKLGDEIQRLSLTLKALGDAGVNIRFEISGWPGSDSYVLPNDNEVRKGYVCELSGMLFVGNNEHILSLIRQKDGLGCEWVLSHNNVRLGQAGQKRKVFDIKNPDCYRQLQQWIIVLAAENKFIQDNDIAEAFSHGPRREARIQLSKPTIKSGGGQK